MRIKLFSETGEYARAGIEDAVNKWLASHTSEIEIQRIEGAIDGKTLVVAIIYRDTTP